MGDRFYQQQKEHKPGRRLKKDVIAELTKVLGDREVKGLDRCTNDLAEIEDRRLGDRERHAIEQSDERAKDIPRRQNPADVKRDNRGRDQNRRRQN